MPVLIYNEKLKIEDTTENISIAFDCEHTSYGSLKLRNNNPNYFDSGDFRIKIEDAIKNFNKEKLYKYLDNNNGIYTLAICNYFIDEIPGIYYIKFISENDETIYYANEIKK